MNKIIEGMLRAGDNRDSHQFVEKLPLGSIKRLNLEPSKENMEAHQLRVVEEKTELDSKLEKLQNFFETETFAQIDKAEQSRLTRQVEVMGSYSEILQERISAF